ncbi:hypothetical protein CsSME_00049064 [Camellia sinensis var. sinensis]
MGSHIYSGCLKSHVMVNNPCLIAVGFKLLCEHLADMLLAVQSQMRCCQKIYIYIYVTISFHALFMVCRRIDMLHYIMSTAIATVVTVAEILKNNGFAVEKSEYLTLLHKSLFPLKPFLGFCN